MILKGRLLVVCAAVALIFGAASAPAFAQGQTAHNLSKTMRHPVQHHKGMMMQRNKR